MKVDDVLDGVRVDPQDRIFLTDYVRAVEVGVYAEEYGVTQSVRFDVSVAVLPATAAGDRLDDVLSYDDLVAAVDAVVDGPRIGVLEVFAERIAANCLGNPRADSVTVRIAKLDRLPGQATLGVEITRSRRGPPVRTAHPA